MDNLEKQLALTILAATGATVSQLGLRFDKVVVELLGDLRTYVEQAVPAGSTVIVTITAPIKLPNKTEKAIEEQIALPLLSTAEWHGLIYENSVHLRIVKPLASKARYRLLGFVHNPGTSPKTLLELAGTWLSQA